MAWDEWEQLKKEAAERGDRGRASAAGAGNACDPAELDDVRDMHSVSDDAERETFVRRGPVMARPGGLEAAQHLERHRRLITRFRDTTVLVPLVPLDGGGMGFLTTDFGGVRWIHAYTDEFKTALCDGAQELGKGPRDFMALRGRRLLDVAIPGMGVPSGVALDVGSHEGAVLIPPVLGVVPGSAAVDAGVDEKGELW